MDNVLADNYQYTFYIYLKNIPKFISFNPKTHHN